MLQDGTPPWLSWLTCRGAEVAEMSLGLRGEVGHIDCYRELSRMFCKHSCQTFHKTHIVVYITTLLKEDQVNFSFIQVFKRSNNVFKTLFGVKCHGCMNNEIGAFEGYSVG